MIKLKTLLSEKFLGFGIGQGKRVKEQQLPDASATDIMQGLDRDPATGRLRGSGMDIADEISNEKFGMDFDNLSSINQDTVQQLINDTPSSTAKQFRLDQLKFDELTKIFPKHYNQIHFKRMQPDGNEGPYYKDALTFPNPNDASTVIGDMESFEDWKESTKRRFGNVTITLDPDAEERWNMVKVEDDKFSQDKKDSDQAKMDTLKSWGTSS